MKSSFVYKCQSFAVLLQLLKPTLLYYLTCLKYYYVAKNKFLFAIQKAT